MHKLYAVGVLPLILGACAAPTPLPDVAALQAPAAPAVPPRDGGYASPMRGFEERPVVDPAALRREADAPTGEASE